MKKKITIISLSTYPMNTPRSLRTHELATELSRQGHEVNIYVLTGEYNYSTYEKETGIQVHSLGHTLFFSYNPLNGMQLTTPAKIIRKLVGKFLEFPHIELIKNTYQSLKKETDIDLLITIALPYPIHWGTALFRTINYRKLKNTIWVADCGDPYMGNEFKSHPFYFKYIEKWFCKQADYITVPVDTAKKAYYPEFSSKIKVIPQGFNFNNIKVVDQYKKNDVPTFIYAGNFYKDLRDPTAFLDYLVSLNLDFRFIVYTKTTQPLKKYRDKLGAKLIIKDFIAREELIYEMSKADFLLNLENPSKVQSPSKLIDYALASRPILSINTNQELNYKLINQFFEGVYTETLIVNNLDSFNIENVASEFLSLIELN